MIKNLKYILEPFFQTSYYFIFLARKVHFFWERNPLKISKYHSKSIKTLNNEFYIVSWSESKERWKIPIRIMVKRRSVKILDLSFHAVYFSSMTTSANAKAVLRSLAFPGKARVLHALDVLVIYGRERCTKCDAIRDFPLSSFCFLVISHRLFFFSSSVPTLLYLFYNRSSGMTRNSGLA